MFLTYGICPACGAGEIAFVYARTAGRVILMCFECEAIWMDARDIRIENVIYTEPPLNTMPELGFPITFPTHGRWATREEIVAQGWEDRIAREWEPRRRT